MSDTTHRRCGYRWLRFTDAYGEHWARCTHQSGHATPHRDGPAWVSVGYEGGTHQWVSDIPPAIRAELDQTHEWWDRQYRALIQKRIPRDAASHDGHDISEARNIMGQVLYRACTDCGVSLTDWEGTE